MRLSSIKTEREYQAALTRIDRLMDAKPGSVEGEDLEVLSELVERYEEEQAPIAPPTPIAAIRFRMQQMCGD